MKVTVGIRTEPEVETMGLDVSEHGMWGYPEFYIPVPGGYGTEHHGHHVGDDAEGRRRRRRRPRDAGAGARLRRDRARGRAGAAATRAPSAASAHLSSKVTLTVAVVSCGPGDDRGRVARRPSPPSPRPGSPARRPR